MPELTTPQENDRVWLNDKAIIEIRVVGKKSADQVHALAEEIIALAKIRRAAGQPVLIIDDLRVMSMKQPGEVPKAVSSELKRLDYDRIAMLGSGNRLLKYGTNLLIRASGKANQVRFFSNRNEAEHWLLQNNT